MLPKAKLSLGPELNNLFVPERLMSLSVSGSSFFLLPVINASILASSNYSKLVCKWCTASVAAQPKRMELAVLYVIILGRDADHEDLNLI